MSNIPFMYGIELEGRDIPPVKLTKTQEEVCRRIISIAKFFFRGEYGFLKIPFRGFLLEGPPGNGKTEIAKQVARKLDLSLRNVNFKLIDSAEIAAPQWGRAEENLKRQFIIDDPNKHLILVLDDVDCLLIKRGHEIAREWHYSINALLFHQLDNIDPSKIIVIATTNRPSLIDYALRSRLFTIKIPKLPLSELREIAAEMLKASLSLQIHSHQDVLIDEILSEIMNKLKSKKNPSIRDVQHFLIEECVKRGVWTT